MCRGDKALIMYEYKAKVVRVIDGDTIVLDVDLGFNMKITDEHFRLVGLNTPSLRSKIKEERETAIKARDRLTELCPVGSEQIVIVKKRKEKYGRYLVIISQPENMTTVNRILINEGLAVPYYGEIE